MTDLQFIMEFLLSEKLTVRLLQNISSGADSRIMMEILAELNISKIFLGPGTWLSLNLQTRYTGGYQ